MELEVADDTHPLEFEFTAADPDETNVVDASADWPWDWDEPDVCGGPASLRERLVIWVSSECE